MTTAARRALVLLLCISSSALAEDYAIRLERSMKVGQKVRIAGDATIQQRNTFVIGKDRRPGESRSGAFAIDAVEEILEKNEHGRTTRSKLTIDKLTEAGEGVDKALLPKGTVVLMGHDGKAMTFVSDEKPVSPQAHLALSLFFHLNPKLRKTDDDVFGAKDRKQVGDAWPINADEAKADMVNDGIDTSKAKIEGEVKLLAARQERGQACLEFSMRMAVEGAFPKELPLPPGAKLTRSRVKGTITAVMPVDPALQPLSANMAQEMELTIALPPQAGVGPVDVESVTKRTKVVTATMVN